MSDRRIGVLCAHCTHAYNFDCASQADVLMVKCRDCLALDMGLCDDYVEVFVGVYSWKGGVFMKLVYSSPVILGFVPQGSQGIGGRYQHAGPCCACTGESCSRA